MSTTSLAERLRAAGFRGEILQDEPLAPCTTWQIGGPAEVLATPADGDDLAAALAWSREQGIPWRVLGNGSNLLVADAGVRGLVLRVKKTLDRVDVDGVRLRAGGGAAFPAVANLAAAHGLAGLEFAAGIPGTVGGAVVMNAGWHEHETGNVVEAVDLVDGDGNRRTLPRDDCGFGYRTSAFKGRDVIVLAALFHLQASTPQRVRADMETYTSSRKRNQPTALPSCGSVYLKPAGDFAGRLIDAAGLKGRRIGGIEVSTLHANFFVNHGGGTCADALALMDVIEAAVRERFGVRLTREVEHWS